MNVKKYTDYERNFKRVKITMFFAQLVRNLIHYVDCIDSAISSNFFVGAKFDD